MEVLRRLTRAMIRAWPTDVGLWRLIRFAPNIAPHVESSVVRLRGLPLKMMIKPQTYVGRFLYYRGMYEDGPIRLLMKVIQPGMTFVDVGANIGLYSIIAAHCVGPSGKVVAIEPQPDLVAILNENAAINGLSNISVHSVALAAECCDGVLHQVSRSNDGQATLKVSDVDHCFGPSLNVKVLTLSGLLSQCGVSSVEILKIDVEGGEYDVLTGFDDWLRTRPPSMILMEVIDAHLQRFESSSGNLFSFLWEREYEIACLFRGRWYTLTQPEDHKCCGFSSDIVAISRTAGLFNRVRTLMRPCR